MAINKITSAPTPVETTNKVNEIIDAVGTLDTGKQEKITASGLLKGNGSGGVSAASAGSDYQAAISATGILKGAGSGSVSAATAGTDYLEPTISIVSITANTTLASSHNGKHLLCTNSSGITITAPINLGAGFNCTLERWGAGGITIARGGTATLNGGTTSLTMGDRYAAAVSIIAVQANVFSVKGGLA